ncbi:hypothetical protein Tco_1517044 [Tanacetum coccineum]
MEAQRLFRRNVPVTTLLSGLCPALPNCNRGSPGYTATFPDFCSSTGAVVSEVAWSPTLEANDGICICPLGSWVVCVLRFVVVIGIAVVVVCSRRPAPTVLGQVAKFPAVMAILVYKDQFDCSGKDHHTSFSFLPDVQHRHGSYPPSTQLSDFSFQSSDPHPRQYLAVIIFFSAAQAWHELLLEGCLNMGNSTCKSIVLQECSRKLTG